MVDRAFAAAHGLLRRKKHGRSAIAQMLAHIEYELESATSEAATVELLAEKARLVDALGDTARHGARRVGSGADPRAESRRRAEGARGADHRARAFANDAVAPESTTAVVSARRGEAYDALAVHLGRMADAYASAGKLAAWLHVEKAQILERRLGRVDAARGALRAGDRARSRASAPCGRRTCATSPRTQTPRRSARALSDEAQIETDPVRSARLELDAACIAHLQLRDDPRAILLLERAATRAPTVHAVDRRVLDELVTLHEAAGEWLEAGRARRARLQFVIGARARSRSSSARSR